MLLSILQIPARRANPQQGTTGQRLETFWPRGIELHIRGTDARLCLLRIRREKMKMGSTGVVETGAASVKVDDRYAFMAKTDANQKAGAADSAWDD